MALKGTHLSDETKKKLSLVRREQGNPWWIGRKHSEETKLRISKSKLGTKSHRKGKKHTEESKKKMSESHKKMSEQTRYNMSICRKGIVPFCATIPKSEDTKRKLSISHIGLFVGDKSPNWIDGRSYDGYCHKFNSSLKERIRIRDNRTCQLCNTKENGIKLDVHHIHYDKKNCNPDLISLCAVCHRKVNYNRDYYESLFMNILKERNLLF